VLAGRSPALRIARAAPSIPESAAAAAAHRCCRELCGVESVSPGGRTILYGLSPWGTGDLMMIENFR
jgi:hypothetical protein